MAYEKQEWKDGQEGETPITAERLNHIEEGINEVNNKADKSSLDDKADKSDLDNYAKSEEVNDKADKTDLDGLVARVEELEK